MRTSLELAEKVLAVLENEETRDAISALKIAMILLPVKPSARLLSILNETPQVPEESVLEAR